jgi:hypothetical protein
VKIVQVLLALLEEAEFPDEVKAKIKNLIDSAAVEATSNPRDETEENRNLLRAALVIILEKIQSLYGDSNAKRIHRVPFFQDQPHSQVGPLKDDFESIGLAIGNSARSWEEVFYEICHETLHLLNPVVDVKSNKVSALEEGCAVRFAEQMYKKYIKPYCNKIPRTSPVGDRSSQYFSAYSAANKIPDDVLKKIRKTFGRFSNIDDAEKFKELVGKYLSDEEVEVLTKPFVYK